MWNDQSAAGGGFFSSPNQFGAASPGQQGGQKSGKRSSRTAPIVIRQALHSGHDGVCIFGTHVQIVSVVARVRSVRVQSTKVTYTVQDITGRMKAVLWLDQDGADDDDDKGVPKVEVNRYIQIFGTVKSNRGRKVLMAFKIIPVEDINLVTFHYLQCINNKVTMEAESKKEKAPATNGTFNSGLPSNSMMGVGNASGASANGLNPRQTLVYDLIRACTLEQGTSKLDMVAALKGRMSDMELENILEWMCGEGHIYSTIDEEHFRATDS